MKLVRCSHCKSEASLLQFGDMPLGWITLKQAGRPDEQHYCGRRCAATALVEAVETEHAETKAADAARYTTTVIADGGAMTFAGRPFDPYNNAVDVAAAYTATQPLDGGLTLRPVQEPWTADEILRREA